MPLEKVGICSNFKMLSFALDRFALNPFEKMFGWEICAPFFSQKCLDKQVFKFAPNLSVRMFRCVSVLKK